jgi:hypothetical protein
MAIITVVIMVLLSLPNIMGMGPISMTPPVLTSPDLGEEDCIAVPTNISMNPISMAIIPVIIMVFPCIIIYRVRLRINNFKIFIRD